MVRLVLVRHGESVWNKEKRFTGWTDVDLTLKGISEAEDCAVELQEYSFVIAFTSVMKRALHTFDIIRSKSHVPVTCSWRLNERHYGDLQGKSKPAVVQEFGEEQTMRWRRSWATPPPPLEKSDPRYKEQVKTFPDAEQPLTESLKDVVERVLPYWYDTIIPALRKGDVLVVAHGNSLRAIVKMLDAISNEDIAQIDIPTGIPLVYELDEHNNFRPTKHYYLGDEEKISAKIQAVKNQIK